MTTDDLMKSGQIESVASTIKAVKRNAERFPGDFMFQLLPKEVARLRFQIGTSKRGRGGRRYAPYAFTEQGGAMLSGVLRSWMDNV